MSVVNHQPCNLIPSFLRLSSIAVSYSSSTSSKSESRLNLDECLINPLSYHSSNFLIIARFFLLFSRSDSLEPVEELTGTSFILENPSHVLVEPLVSAVAAPILGLISSTFPRSIFISSSFLPPKLNIPPNDDDFSGATPESSIVCVRSFNSFSRLSRSCISTLVDDFEDIFLSFIKSSTPGPKFTEDCSPSCRLKETGSRLSNPISMTSICFTYVRVTQFIFKSSA